MCTALHQVLLGAEASISVWCSHMQRTVSVFARALMESQVDAGLKEEAGKTCVSALQLARKRLPDRLLGVVKLCLFYRLGEGKSAEKESKSLPEFPVVSKLYKLKQ